MSKERIARELLKISKELIGYAPELDDYFSRESKQLNYRVADMVMDEIDKIAGVESVGRSDGFNDETTFTIIVEPKPAKKDWARRNSGGQLISEFEVPLRKLASEIKRALKMVKMPVIVKGEKSDKTPILDSKISGPRRTSWKDEYGERHRVYQEPANVRFDIYITHK